MKKAERYKYILGWFEDNMPEAETELKYSSPYELLIAVILSAQCIVRSISHTRGFSCCYTGICF